MKRRAVAVAARAIARVTMWATGFIILFCVILSGCGRVKPVEINTGDIAQYAGATVFSTEPEIYETTTTGTYTSESYDADAHVATPAGDRKLYCRYNDMDEFYASLKNARAYKTDGHISAGVVPHHLTAARLIGGFFEMCAADPDGYDTVVVIAPNHTGDIADIVYSRRDWDILDGVACDADIAGALAALHINGASIVENDDRVEDDHSVSVLTPYIGHCLPGANIVPILVNRSMTLDATAAFAAALTKIINESGKCVLLVCSIDFSHTGDYLQVARNDATTAEAIKTRDYNQIQNMQRDCIDSPAALIIFLSYLDATGATAQVIDHADASEFTGRDLGPGFGPGPGPSTGPGPGAEETTSYFIVTAE